MRRPPQVVQRSLCLRVVQQLRERDQGILDGELDGIGIGDDTEAGVL